MSIHSKLLVALILTQISCYPAEGKNPLSTSPELPAANNMLLPLFDLRNRNETVPAQVNKQRSQTPKVGSIPEEQKTEQENQPTK